MKNSILRIANLSFGYDKKIPILEKVSLEIQEGEWVGIFGPNGGGKTTLLKLILGFLHPSEGKISLFGKKPQEVRTRIGYVPQALPLDRSFPVSVLNVVMMGQLSQLTWWGSYPKECKSQALALLDQMDLLPLAHRHFGSLSGGQAQRVLIARALISEPQLLILDEPTANIDPLAEQMIFSLLQKLSSKVTILMVTHDLQTMLDKSKRLVCVNRQVSCLEAKEVCEHFALGLYHTPLTQNHFPFT